MASARKTTVGSIDKRFGKRLGRLSNSDIDLAVQTYGVIGKRLANARVSANQIMGQDGDKLVSTLQPHHIGKMVMYFYNPKLKDDPKKLPYYDRAPLIIVLSVDAKGWLGMNFHYLHPLLRAYLLDMLLKDSEYSWFRTAKNRRYTAFQRRKINMTYRKLQAAAQSGLYKPCIKRYLWGHQMSRFYVVEPDDWTKFIALPIERFERAAKQTVWQKSLEQVYR